METKPQREHEWLQKLVGEWTYEAECEMGPDQAPAKSSGTETVRSLGGLWTVAEAHGEMPGCGSTTMLCTLGYDPQRKRYVGTFLASNMAYLWHYSGELDPSGKVLALRAEGPDVSGKQGTAQYTDAIEFVSDDHRILTSSVLTERGTWHKFMTAHYHRKK